MIYFITGNKNKFLEVKSIISNVEQFEIDLDEIQDIDAKRIIEHKLKEAFKHKKGEFIVEDTSLYLNGLNGLPGPLIKWFLNSLGNKGIYELVSKLGNNFAEAKTIIGYAKNSEEIYFFEGSIKGKIVFPSGETGFDWDSIFQPAGFEKTFQQMSKEEKNSISMRSIATNKLKDFLNKN